MSSHDIALVIIAAFNIAMALVNLWICLINLRIKKELDTLTTIFKNHEKNHCP